MSTVGENVSGRGNYSSWLGAIFVSRIFWLAIAIVILFSIMASISEFFVATDNILHLTRNIAFLSIVTVGMTAVLITGGIDLSLGAIMGLVGVVTALVLNADYPIITGIAAGLLVAFLCGLVNGVLIAYFKLSSLLVTLAMLGIAHGLAVVFSERKILYNFGPDEDAFLQLGGGISGGIAHPVIVMFLLFILIIVTLKATTWGRWLYAVMEKKNQADKRYKSSIRRVEFSVYVLSALLAAVAAILIVSWKSSTIESLSHTHEFELRVLAAALLGGASITRGNGGVVGALLGAVLLELLLNSLVILGVGVNWQDVIIGICIVVAVLWERLASYARFYHKHEHPS